MRPKCQKVFIKTFGCQMNDRDSEHVIAQFLNNGYTLKDTQDSADVILLNTCSVRQHAEDRVWSYLGILKRTKKKNPDLVIGVLGCMAESLKNEIIKRMPHVDLVCGPNDLARVYELVQSIRKSQKNILAVGLPKRNQSFYQNSYQKDNNHSFVVIMEGCNNFCSYCVVPYVRGKERSRPFKDILEEIKQLVKRRITLVTLLGQNVNSYSGGCSFPSLLKRINHISGVKEISFATSHPKDANIELFEVMRDHKKIKNYLHLPLQSGSDRILKLMNRGYTQKEYLKLVQQFRKIVGKDATIGTDVIVGFPSETDGDFLETSNLIKKVQFDGSYIFKYSPRFHTKAMESTDDVSLETKKKRHKILLDTQRKISKKLKK